jgi:hypothetical protein
VVHLPRVISHYNAALLSALAAALFQGVVVPGSFAAGPGAKPQPEMEVIRPGQPGVRPFWNLNSGRFIHPPAFDFKLVEGAASYRFRVAAADKEHVFTSPNPWDPLSPVWPAIPQGYTELTVEGLDGQGKVVGVAGKRQFYRSPGFPGATPPPEVPYLEAGRLGLRALFIADHVQHWIKKGGPDPAYEFYCYPGKIMGALVRAMTDYAKLDPASAEGKQARDIAERVADHLLRISMPEGTPYEFFPPTYVLDVNKPKRAAVEALEKRWMMTHYACDAAFGYMDLHKLTGNQKYLAAARRIADTYAKTQQPDGTWPLVVNFETGQEEAPNRLVPTWIIFLLDRLDREFGIKDYAACRERAWRYVVENPLRTFAWDAQFEDTKPRPTYRNLSREQACDTAMILFDNPQRTREQVETARELLRFSEDQFVVWSPVTDPEGWRKVRLEREFKPPNWITPSVLEQYTCYMPVARSSAIFIKAYLSAYKATGEAVYLEKARALANSLVTGQQYQVRQHKGKGEIPTWVTREPPRNWLNNSYYAAEALVDLARVK